jgi:hypothetical protein
MFGRREMKRTCKRCSTEWFVPRELVKRPPKPGWEKWAAAGATLNPLRGGAAAAHRASVLHKQQRYDSWQTARRCPSCGSQAYREKLVRV